MWRKNALDFEKRGGCPDKWKRMIEIEKWKILWMNYWASKLEKLFLEKLFASDWEEFLRSSWWNNIVFDITEKQHFYHSKAERDELFCLEKNSLQLIP